MGTAAFERDAVVEIDGQKYRLLRKVSETCWQLEHTNTARISELEQEQTAQNVCRSQTQIREQRCEE